MALDLALIRHWNRRIRGRRLTDESDFPKLRAGLEQPHNIYSTSRRAGPPGRK